MATWTRNPQLKNSSSRRKWNLEDRTSLNNLKHHFASDGCSDVQYDLARQFLEKNSDLDETSSNVQGVHWLLCAAKQGHEGALEMLRECYKQRRGITELNENEVKSCLFMTPGERAARKAARELFACLSNGGETITPYQLERQMRKIYKLKKKSDRNHVTIESNKSASNEDLSDQLDNDRKNIDDTFYGQNDNYLDAELDLTQENLITEANLISAAVNYSRGRLPPVNDVLTLSVPNAKALDHIPVFHRIVLHPIIFFTLLYHRFVKIISSFPGAIESNVKMLALFVLYVLISCENLNTFLPMIVYYITLMIMICSTFRMFKKKQEYIDFRMWSNLFLSYGEDIDAGFSENQFLRNNMRPYVYFLIAFITNVLVYPLISTEYLPHSEITVLSLMMVFLTLIVFMYTSANGCPDFLILTSFAINISAKYPYEMDSVVATSWRFLDLKVPTFSSFVVGTSIEFCLNCRAMFYILIPFFMMQLAKRSRWHGIYSYLIPHCITICWLQISITSSQSATTFGLMRSILGMAGILLFLPIFGVITLMVPIFLTIDYLGLSDPRARMASSITIGLLLILGSCFMAINQRTQKYITFLQIIICVIAAAILTVPYFSNVNKPRTENSIYQNSIHQTKPLSSVISDGSDLFLSWNDFYNYCNQPAWKENNKIKAQLRCSQLEGMLVYWDGTVTDVRISKVSNSILSLIKRYLPNSLGNYIICFYGEKNSIDCDGEQKCEPIKHILNTKCNLNKWNKYEYEIKIKMTPSGLLSSASEIYLKAGNIFGNFSSELRNSDKIWFKGTLINKRNIDDDNAQYEEIILGGGKDVIEVNGMGCITCQNKNLSAIEIKTKALIHDRLRDLTRGLKFLLNVVFNPLIIFK